MQFDLNIFNGDIACELGRKCGLAGEHLVWRETYLEGPLLETDDLHLFRSARAEFLSNFTEVESIGCERLYRYLQKLDDTLFALSENSKLMLWFDSCIFDQTMLMRILYLLAQRKNSMPRVFLYCCSGNVLTAYDFQRGGAESIQLATDDLQTAARAWKLFCRQDADSMRLWTEEGNFSNLPAMKKALIRCAEEVPDAGGLNRTRRQILQVVAAGKSSFTEIFKALGELEDLPFLGDTACQRHLDYLTSQGFIVCRQEHYFIAG